MSKGQLNRTVTDQLTNGQLEWVKLSNPYDVVTIGQGSEKREYPIYADMKRYAKELKDRFPSEEHAAIDKYIHLVRQHLKGNDVVFGAMRLIPLPLAKILCT